MSGSSSDSEDTPKARSSSPSNSEEEYKASPVSPQSSDESVTSDGVLVEVPGQVFLFYLLLLDLGLRFVY